LELFWGREGGGGRGETWWWRVCKFVVFIYGT
jgi:hypothetical protein